MSFFPLKLYVLLIFSLAIGLLAAVEGLSEKEAFTISHKILDRVEKKYGPEARKRLLAWENLIREDDAPTAMARLHKVNSFFNNMNFVDDLNHWNADDYWATPIEFLASNGGDCEDFSVAKYFTLRAMGIPEERLYLVYVKALRLNQAHMVLAYYAEPGSDPLILDNIMEMIKSGSQRTDLLPVYSFNGTGLWIAKQRGNGEFIGQSDRLKRWRELLERMEESD